MWKGVQVDGLLFKHVPNVVLLSWLVCVTLRDGQKAVAACRSVCLQDSLATNHNQNPPFLTPILLLLVFP